MPLGHDFDDEIGRADDPRPRDPAAVAYQQDVRLHHGPVVTVELDVDRGDERHAGPALAGDAGFQLIIDFSVDQLVNGGRSAHIVKDAVDQFDAGIFRKRLVIRDRLVRADGRRRADPICRFRFLHAGHFGAVLTSFRRESLCKGLNRVISRRRRFSAEDFPNGSGRHAGDRGQPFV